jgi:hypothetical protein
MRAVGSVNSRAQHGELKVALPRPQQVLADWCISWRSITANTSTLWRWTDAVRAWVVNSRVKYSKYCCSAGSTSTDAILKVVSKTLSGRSPGFCRNGCITTERCQAQKRASRTARERCDCTKCVELGSKAQRTRMASLCRRSQMLARQSSAQPA